MARLSTLFIVALVLAPTAASADVFKLYGEAKVGGMYGSGIAGDQKDASFFQTARGLGYGGLIGGQFLILDAHIKHTQYRHDSALSTWTQFNGGLNFTLDLGSEEDKKAHKGGYFEIGAFVGFGVGTGAQVMPPLDASEVTDKGFFLEGRLGFGKHINKVLDIGVTIPASWGYIFKSGAANDESNQYQSVQADVMLVARFNIRFI
jgi:hypothetical protein